MPESAEPQEPVDGLHQDFCTKISTTYSVSVPSTTNSIVLEQDDHTECRISVLEHQLRVLSLKKRSLHEATRGFVKPHGSLHDSSVVMIVCFGITIVMILINVHMQMGMFTKQPCPPCFGDG